MIYKVYQLFIQTLSSGKLKEDWVLTSFVTTYQVDCYTFINHDDKHKKFTNILLTFSFSMKFFSKTFFLFVKFFFVTENCNYFNCIIDLRMIWW